MSSHDITFCTESNCAKKDKCYRATDNHIFKDDERVSMFMPTPDKDGNCEFFWDMKK